MMHIIVCKAVGGSRSIIDAEELGTIYIEDDEVDNIDDMVDDMGGDFWVDADMEEDEDD